ncbi:MAG TPA: MBL fold metallo-hydrolase [Clostridiales bacterium]|nr:MBL fold metallo-hydrolase [Clostridiales bacterium]
MSFSLISLSSSSSGNATYVQAGKSKILVDAGLSGKKLTCLLHEVGASAHELDAILVTHEHVDHVRGAAVLSNRFGIPVYATGGTFKGMEQGKRSIAQNRRIEIEPDVGFIIGDCMIDPLPIPHDANQPVAFRLSYRGASVAVVTDLGHCSNKLLEKLAGVDVLLLESNYNPQLLLDNPRYPSVLKRRIQGRKGHLSNENCANALYELQRLGTKYALLGHLSKENNRPELAIEEVSRALCNKGVRLSERLHLDLCHPDRPSARYALNV